MMRKGKVPDRNGVMWCDVCRGQLKGKCCICGQKNSAIREEFPELVEHWSYIRNTAVKLRKFGMATTGVQSVDSDCADYGLKKISTRPTALIEERSGQFYAWLFANNQIFEIAETEQLAKIGLAIKANHWQSVFSPHHVDYLWSYNSTRKPMPLPNGAPICVPIPKEDFNVTPIHSQTGSRCGQQDSFSGTPEGNQTGVLPN